MSHKRKQKSKTKERIKTSLWFDSYRQNQNEIKLSFVGDDEREKKVARQKSNGNHTFWQNE